MEYLKINKLKALSALLLIIIGASCTKEVPFTEEVGQEVSSTSPVTGTFWTDINPDPDKRITALSTIDDKMIISQTWLGGLSALFDGESFDYCDQTISTFGPSGFGIEKFQRSSDGSWYGSGFIGIYGAFQYDSTDVDTPWSPAMTTYTSSTATVKINDNLYVACNQSPRVRSGGVAVGNELDGVVHDLIEYNGELIAGGSFQNSGSTPVNRVARWNGIEWLPLGTGLDGSVIDLEIWNGLLVAAGNFDANGSGNSDCSQISAWNGAEWIPLGTGITGGFNGVKKLLSNGGELIIGGDFDYGGNVFSPNLIKWNGSEYVELAGGAPSMIGEMTIFQGQLYVANSSSFGSTDYLLRLD